MLSMSISLLDLRQLGPYYLTVVPITVPGHFIMVLLVYIYGLYYSFLIQLASAAKSARTTHGHQA